MPAQISVRRPTRLRWRSEVIDHFQFQFVSRVFWGVCVMSAVSAEARATATEIDRRFRQVTGKNVSIRKFAVVAKAIWPRKTALALAVIAGTNERTAARWLAGEFDPPGVIIAAIIVEITKR